MNYEQANRLKLVEYSYVPRCIPAKISKKGHWYLSTLRQKTKASFKVNREKNVRCDYGAEKGCGLVDFTIRFYHFKGQHALQQLLANLPMIKLADLSNKFSSNALNIDNYIHGLFPSFHQQNEENKDVSIDDESSTARPPFPLHENSLLDSRNAAETAIRNIAAKQPFTDPLLCRYVEERRIDKKNTDTYCYNETIRINNKDEADTALSFKNSTGGYKSRNDFFKLSSASKGVIDSSNFEKENNFKTKSQSEYSEHKNDFKTDTSKQIFEASKELQNDVEKAFYKLSFEVLNEVQTDNNNAAKKDESNSSLFSNASLTFQATRKCK